MDARGEITRKDHAGNVRYFYHFKSSPKSNKLGFHFIKRPSFDKELFQKNIYSYFFLILICFSYSLSAGYVSISYCYRTDNQARKIRLGKGYNQARKRL